MRSALPRPEDRLKRLLTIGHSYVVAENRRLAHELALAGAGEWDVTVGAPSRLRGDLREIVLTPLPGEACRVAAIDMRLGGHPHLRHFGRQIGPLLRQPWDVVHCWEEPYVAATAQIARRVPSSARFVPATFQNLSKRYPWPVAMIERRVMQRADAWIAFGETVHEALRDRTGYASKPSRVITPGVDVEAFRPDPAARRAMRERLGWGPTDIVVGFTGRFVAEKGIGTLLDAFARSAERWNLLFVGGGEMQADIDTLRLRHPARVRVLTGVPHDGVAACLNAMDILCAPSRTTPRWREQFGRMLIEAMACGVPVIASRSGEIPHVVDDAGILVDESDADGWVQQIDRLARDAGARRDLSARGVAQARSRFSWPVIARAHLAFFTELCA